jgi:hypothetical protein
MKYSLSILFSLLLATLIAQPTSYDEMEFESDEIPSQYAAKGHNYAYLKSKRGTSGMNHTSTADSIRSFHINEIVLVFTEVNEGDIDEREDANRERWDNLMMTYPEFFKPGVVYKNICQCKEGGDAEAFKHVQGFYVYYKPEAPKAAEPAKPAKVAEEKPVTKTEEKKPEKPAAKEIAETKKPEEKKAEEKPVKTPEKEVAVEEKPVTKTKEEPVQEERTPAVVTKTEAEPVANDANEEVVEKKKPGIAKKGPAMKARRAKDKKACRPACYQGGDEDLNSYFKDAITLTKKQRRKGKHLVCVLKLQLNVDGSIKNATVTGENEVFNQQILGAANSMNKWNAAVKNGVTVKSDVKITLKYDKPTKSIKPSEVIVNPRPGPKCKCMSDSEIFD